MRIGELSKRSGVSVDTLRYYERRGLIRADRWPNGYRDYPEGTEEVLGLIRLAQSLGFSLSEVAQLTVRLDEGLSEAEIATLLSEKQAEIDARIANLTQLREALALRAAQACPVQSQQKVAAQ
jgi:MerR family copper efflux transcriptional regulator